MNPVCTKDPADSTKYVEGTGTIGGWEHSEMRAWLKDSVKPSIDETVRNSIKTVTKYSNITDQSGTVVKNVTSTEDIWIPSAKEAGFDNGESAGPAYTVLFKSNTDRLKQHDGTSSSTWWWLRTACAGYIYGIVNSNGSSGYSSANHSGSIVFGFCM